MAARSGTATPKSAVTREKIMAAAAELMVERGGTDFQMMEVSARCEMSKGSLYYYFADKGELVRAVLDRSVEALVDAVERVVAQAPSAAACEDCRSANMRAISRIGSNIDTLYDMNTFSVPIVIVPENTS